MRMKIFTNEILHFSESDYSRWETFNGDYVNVSEVGSTYIERCLDMLELFSEQYPNHPNYPIWRNYITIFEQELLERDHENALFI